MKLLDLLKEKGVPPSPFKPGEVPVMIKLVFWDEENGLKDPKKVNEILRILERNLVSHKQAYEPSGMDVKEVMNGIKYYPQTDKIVGNYPRYVFFEKGKSSRNMAVTMHNCAFRNELGKVSKTLEVKKKTV
jgi:hypothetical protein